MKINEVLKSDSELVVKFGEIKYKILDFTNSLTSNFITFPDIDLFYSISKDDKSYTDWELVQSSDWYELFVEFPFFLKLKLKYSSFIEKQITIKDLSFVLDKPKPYIIAQGESIHLSGVTEDEMFDYAEMGQSLVKLETDLNYFINKHNGIRVTYFHTNPDMQTKDDFLKEFSLYNTVSQKIIKVVATDNKTPIPKHEFSQWGIEFEKLEIYIEKTYFEEMFGVNENPRSYDYIYFKELNRMYYIEDNYLEHGINEVGNFYVCVLKKYQDISAVDKDEDSLDFLKDHISVQDYTEQQKMEMTDGTNFQQNIAKDVVYDIVRNLVSKSVTITDNEFKYKSSVISNHYYDMTKPTSQVIYKPTISMGVNGGMSIMFWINPVILNVGKRNESKLSGKLLSVGNDFELYVNDDTKTHNIDIPQDYNGYVCCVYSINNQFKTISKFVYRLVSNGLQRVDYSNNTIQDEILFTNDIVKLYEGNYNIRCVRFSNYVIQDQYHQYIMLAKNIKKASAFTIIDDCEPIINLRKIKKSVFPEINKETFGDVI